MNDALRHIGAADNTLVFVFWYLRGDFARFSVINEPTRPQNGKGQTTA